AEVSRPIRSRGLLLCLARSAGGLSESRSDAVAKVEFRPAGPNTAEGDRYAYSAATGPPDVADPQYSTTDRIDLPSCIRSNASLIRSSGIVCVIRSSILIRPSMYQSTIFGTSVRPRAPPKALPRHTRPVTSWNGRVEIS